MKKKQKETIFGEWNEAIKKINLLKNPSLLMVLDLMLAIKLLIRKVLGILK